MDILREAKFLLEADEERRAILIYPTIENEPLCLNDKEALALAAMIKNQTQSWCER